MTLPLLGLLGGHTDSTESAPLVVALRTWCRPHAFDPGLGPPAAILATSPAAIGLDGALRGRIPVAVIAGSHSMVTAGTQEHATVIIVRDVESAAEIGDRALLWRREALATSDHPYLSPFVRERWRARLGLPNPMVVGFGSTSPSPLAESDALAALAVCSAAVVRGPLLLPALALGTPVVTDATTAAAIGAEASVHLAIAPISEARAVADALAADPARAAAVGWGGRQLVEEEYDLGRLAFDVVVALGIGPREFPVAPLARLDAELEALGTPLASPVAIRALRHAATIAGPVDWTDLTGRRR